ncbi:S8 family peptidase [Ruminiclostridium cellulolyticum]|uniref:Peptidase S8 and S53 subtilisin kexin sedolisin n=1 Tax=Ruminiclostridium cellulolyticum (strain ATCC 35319 / DSM 5812 / JCM 6584 / H10) TaxID=394503 RepID=B8I1V0_RUMCH|nr:S8 family serine peptidase [Ruminiclostridium cellulolyticum]ACL77735.1 peptidase S8 and S53 subtilisin kexin sedolisin [Ruminiclostridium cellulolyticum H10]
MNTLPINIAVIDDGVNEKLYQTGKLAFNLEITHDLSVCNRTGYDSFFMSHGTTCAAIIKKYSPEAVLGSIKILDSDSRTGMKAQLIWALKWCVENRIRIVNLSLGTIDYRDFAEIKEVVDYACERNVIVVAACNNRNILTCPASLENVIGVKCDLAEVLNEGEYTFNYASMDGIDITAFAKHSLKKHDGTNTVTGACNSYAAPFVTSQVYNLIRDNPNIDFTEIIGKLQQEASPAGTLCVKSPEKRKEPDIPVILINNQKAGSFEKGLTGKFRGDGFNAVCVFLNPNESDVSNICNGYIDIRRFTNQENPSIKNSFYDICGVFNPDIILFSSNNQKSNKVQSQGIMELDPDIEICINDISIEVKSSYGIQSYSNYNNNQLEQVYSYILELFEKEEE